MSQQLEALQIANRVRFDGMHVRQEVTAGVITVEQAFNDPRAERMQVGRLLCAQRGWGPSRVHRLLNTLMVWPTRRVGDLTERQRARILEALGSK
jgi:hypothetical protein